MSGRSQPTYFNAIDRTVIEYRDASGDSVSTVISTDLAIVSFEHTMPARSVPSWKGKNVYEGDYWASTTRGFVHHESFLEREYLMAADSDPSILAFAWQPFILKWPKGTKGHRGHVPDYFCRLSTGDGLVVDVKRPDKAHASEQQFAMTREVCEEVGWRYEVFTGLPEPRLSNLTFLCGFRQDRYSPGAEDVPALLDAFTPETSLEAGVRRAVRATGRPRPVVHGNVLHLLWNSVLTVDLDAPLDLASPVWVPSAVPA
ncbi:TnsA-like heteromeric transposase endonuclease subunit [Nostocoides vanveenii]|uniref:TnsA-like heteromeric transposase endonuclease subunit n=1 Tax=Nostocoides vanveenii TaxID=330835 RepID=A0ABN2KES1_9MICO